MASNKKVCSFLDHDSLISEPSQTEEVMNLDLGRHPYRYSLCSSSRPSLLDILLS